MLVIRPKTKGHQSKTDLEQECIGLSWKILYNKALYYELGHRQEYDYLRISDHEFDALTKRYETVCKLLHKKPTANCVGFDKTKASHIAALTKVLLDHHNRNNIQPTAKVTKRAKTRLNLD